MDLDSIIYIVIAVALAIINAVAQKKKKAAKQVTSQPPTHEEDYEPETLTPPEMEEKTPAVQLQDILQQIANETALLDIPESVSETKKEITYEQPIDLPISSIDEANSILDSPVAANQYVPIDIPKTDFSPENAIDSIEEYDYNAKEGSIAATAITDALTEEEEHEFKKSLWSDTKKRFNPKDAVIYSEIIKPKYFSINPNY